MQAQLDRTDWRILDYLQRHGDASAAEVAEHVGLSQSPCWRRIQRLNELGVIKSRAALLDRKKVNLDVLVFAHVKLQANGGDKLKDFRKAIQNIAEVQECYLLMGQVDFLIRIVTKDVESYEKLFFEKLSRLPAVREINSMIAVSTVKETTELPLMSVAMAD